MLGSLLSSLPALLVTYDAMEASPSLGPFLSHLLDGDSVNFDHHTKQHHEVAPPPSIPAPFWPIFFPSTLLALVLNIS